MSTTRSIAALATAALLAAAPAALATGPPANPGAHHKPAHAAGTPGPNAPAGVKAKAYGRFCQGQSKKHVAGEKGTAFSRCVTAMAKAATHKASPTAACAGLSHKHTAGQPGTPFSRCVVAARHLANQSAKPAGA